MHKISMKYAKKYVYKYASNMTNMQKYAEKYARNMQTKYADNLSKYA